MEVQLVEIKLRKGYGEEHFVCININEILKMYKNGRLKNANVFGHLFGLNDSSLFKEKVNVVIDLFSYDITYNDWILLYGFLKSGKVTPLLKQKEQKKNIEDCYKTTLKLGGLPSFDLFYESCSDGLQESNDN